MKRFIYALSLITLLFSCTKEEFMYEDPEMAITSVDPVDYSNSKFNLFDTVHYTNGYTWTTLTPWQGGTSPNEIKIDINLKTDAGHIFNLSGTFDTIFSVGYYGNNAWDSAIAIDCVIDYKGYNFVQQIQMIFPGTGAPFQDGRDTESPTEVILYLPQCVHSDFTNDTICFEFNEVELYKINTESENY